MTSTVYQSTRAHVIHGDARDALAEIATESIDLVVTDPPYGQEWQSNRRTATERFDLLHGDGQGDTDREGIREILVECVRVVGQNRHLYAFGPTDVLDGLKVASVVALTWDKLTVGSGDTSLPWAPAHEPITFAVSKFRHAGEAGREGVPARLRKGSVLRYTRPTGRKVRHPSEKPVALLRELIESSSRQGETVIDPCGGIGSTGVAAVLLGRRTIVVDSDLKWCEIAAERIAAAEAHVDSGRWL